MEVPPQYKNPSIYRRAKATADKKFDKPSAYKSGFLVREYKRLGGKYETKRKGTALKKAIRGLAPVRQGVRGTKFPDKKLEK